MNIGSCFAHLTHLLEVVSLHIYISRSHSKRVGERFVMTPLEPTYRRLFHFDFLTDIPPVFHTLSLAQRLKTFPALLYLGHCRHSQLSILLPSSVDKWNCLRLFESSQPFLPPQMSEHQSGFLFATFKDLGC